MKENLTIVLAVWGAILSTILAIIEFVRFYSDKPRLRVTVTGGWKVFPKDTKYGDMTLVTIKAANIGKRPITLSGGFLLQPKGRGNYLMCTDQSVIGHRELLEGQSCDYPFNEEKVRANGITPDKYVAAVCDATGRIYWSHNPIVRFMKLRRFN